MMCFSQCLGDVSMWQYVYPLSGRDSPPANEASEDMDEAMPIPEDLSASSGLQQNNRQADKGLGEFGHSPTSNCFFVPSNPIAMTCIYLTVKLVQTILYCIHMRVCQYLAQGKFYPLGVRCAEHRPLWFTASEFLNVT